MGYYTNFVGEFDIVPDITVAHQKEFWDWAKEKHGYHAWVITEDGGLAVRGEGKWYSYCAELKQDLNEFFLPKGYHLSGTVNWYGEENSDMGKIILDTKEGVTVKRKALVSFDSPEPL